FGAGVPGEDRAVKRGGDDGGRGALQVLFQPLGGIARAHAASRRSEAPPVRFLAPGPGSEEGVGPAGVPGIEKNDLVPLMPGRTEEFRIWMLLSSFVAGRMACAWAWGRRGPRSNAPRGRASTGFIVKCPPGEMGTGDWGPVPVDPTHGPGIRGRARSRPGYRA